MPQAFCNTNIHFNSCRTSVKHNHVSQPTQVFQPCSPLKHSHVATHRTPGISLPSSIENHCTSFQLTQERNAASLFVMLSSESCLLWADLLPACWELNSESMFLWFVSLSTLGCTVHHQLFTSESEKKHFSCAAEVNRKDQISQLLCNVSAQSQGQNIRHSSAQK